MPEAKSRLHHDGYVIGPRLRALRLAQGLTLQQVADAAGVTKGYLSRLERDELSPTVGMLVSLCKPLNVEPSTLFEREEVDVIAIGQIEVGANEVQGIFHSLLSPPNSKLLTVVHTVLQPGASSSRELYPMFCESQTAVVLKGRVCVRFSNREINLTTGEAITFAGREPHSYENPDGENAAELIWVLVPAAGR